MRFCCAGSITGSRIRAISTSEPRFAISRSARMNGAAPIEWPATRRIRSICTARAMPIRAKAMARSYMTRLTTDEPRDVFVYDPEVPVIAPGGPQALSGPFDQAAHRDGQQPARLHLRASCNARPRSSDSRASSCTRPHPRRTRTSPPNSCASRQPAARSSSPSASRAVPGSFAMRATRPIRSTRGSSRWSPLPLCSRPAIVLRLEIASSAFPLYDRNPSTARLRRSLRTTGTGRVPRSKSCIRQTHPVRALSPRTRRSRHGDSDAGSSVPEILLKGVSKRFRSAAVCASKISRSTVERGEFVTFLGPSGCGKSTLLKLVSGLSPVSEGAVSKSTE